MNFNQEKTLEIIKLLSFFMSGLVLLGLFTKGTQGILNISSAILFLTSSYYLIFSSGYEYLTGKIKNFIISRKSFVSFNLWCIFSIVFFSYANFSDDALSEYLKDWRYIVVLFLFYAAFNKFHFEIRKYFILSTVVILFYICFFVPVQRLLSDNSQDLYLQLRYGFAFYVVLLFPFAFTSVFFVTAKLQKSFFIVLSLSAIFFLIYTGSRGGILSLIVEFFIIAYFLKKNKRQFFISSISFIVFMSIILSISYNSIDRVKRKVDQSMNITKITSSRDKILETRFPIVINGYKNFLFGIGYGSSSYNDYLTDNNAPKFSGGGFKSKGVYKYNNDEPFFITLLYNIGIIGLVMFLLSMFVNIKILLADILVAKDRLNIALFSSFIGYFLVYCIFESMFMEIYFLFTVILFFLLNKSKKMKNIIPADK